MIYPQSHTGQVLRFGIPVHEKGGDSIYRHIQRSRATSKSTKKGRFKQTLSKNIFSSWIETSCHAVLVQRSANIQFSTRGSMRGKEYQDPTHLHNTAQFLLYNLLRIQALRGRECLPGVGTEMVGPPLFNKLFGFSK